MVFLSPINLVRNPGPSKFWRVQQYLRFSWRFRGRKRNCFRIGMRYVHKALMYSYQWRKLKKVNLRTLWNTRLEAAVQEHGMDHGRMLEGLARCNVNLDRKTLCDLAIYEPRTFESLCKLSQKRLEEEGLSTATMPKPQGVFTRGML